jgi:hypothetical protein
MIGTFTFAWFGEYLQKSSYKKGIIVVFIIVALTDLIYLPMITELDLYIKVGNKTIANFIGIQDEMISVNTMTWIGCFEFISWLVQSVIAYFSGLYLYKKIIKRALTSASS